MRHVSAVIVVAVFVCLVTFPKHQHVTSTIFMTTANAATVPPAGITTADVTPADVTTADIATVTSPQPAARDVYSAATTAKTLNSTTAEPDLSWQTTAGGIAVLIGALIFNLILAVMGLRYLLNPRRCLADCIRTHCGNGAGRGR